MGVWKKKTLSRFCISTLSSVPERTGRISTISTSKGTALGGCYLWVPGKRSWIGSAYQGFYRCLEWTGRILFIVPQKEQRWADVRSWAGSAYQGNFIESSERNILIITKFGSDKNALDVRYVQVFNIRSLAIYSRLRYCTGIWFRSKTWQIVVRGQMWGVQGSVFDMSPKIAKNGGMGW